jgi:hypothetical protein
MPIKMGAIFNAGWISRVNIIGRIINKLTSSVTSKKHLDSIMSLKLRINFM